LEFYLMPNVTMTDRQLRERDYYDTFTDQRGMVEPNFESIQGREFRPWNPYWRLFQLVQERFKPGAQLLDFGCGWGTNTIVFAKMGYRVEGFDISSKNVDATLKLAAKYDVADRVQARVDVAEALSYPADTFDVLVGIDILHHIDISKTMGEVRRVLKPGGVAFFREPVEQVVFDRLRNSKLVTRYWPNQKSFEKHITDDERKLNKHDIAIMRIAFPSMQSESFRMLSRLDAVVPSLIGPLERLDWSLARFPIYASWRGTALFILNKDAV
jgi:2-polyprenyl-3-methyl-5-hydroxy-6-metoxy-1,4-benzoquinol methylase